MARGVELVVYGAGDRGGSGGGEEVEPGVCERDDGDMNTVLKHESAFGSCGRVRSVDGAAAVGYGNVRVVVRGEDDEAGWGGRQFFGVVDVGDGCVGGEE